MAQSTFDDLDDDDDDGPEDDGPALRSERDDPLEGDVDDADDLDDAETVACPCCGKAVYEEAEQCPYCGRFILPEDGLSRRRWWVWAGVILGVIGVLWWIF